MKLHTLLINRRMNRACAALSRQASPPLHILCLVRISKMTSRKHVELIFLLVHGAVREPKEDTSGKGDDGDGAIVPYEMGVSSQGGKSLGQGGGKGSGEALHGLDEGTHILGRLCKGVLERGDGRKDFGYGDEDVDSSDGPNGDGGLVVWVARLVVARGLVAGTCQNQTSKLGVEQRTRSTGGQTPRPWQRIR